MQTHKFDDGNEFLKKTGNYKLYISYNGVKGIEHRF